MANAGLPRIAMLEDACCGCGACAACCPTGCIDMASDSCGFLRPAVNASRCVGCGSCDATCPALNRTGKDDPRKVVWARCADVDALARSSSGGMFYLLAKEVLSKGGVVCGAAWTDGCRSVEHVVIRDVSSLDSIMRSKYVQSGMRREIYEQMRDHLRRGAPVLFSGTACQVAGVRAYLGSLADADNFLAVDIVCHGVPSPVLWRRWARHLCRDGAKELSEVNFRNKERSWRRYCVSYQFEGQAASNGGRRVVEHRRDWYMCAFLSNASLRASCFGCQYKRSCGSDLTLGDFWGVEKEHRDAPADDKGISAVIANTGKGESALCAVLASCEWRESQMSKVVAHNSALVRPVEPFAGRDAFMRAIAEGMTVREMMKRWRFRPTLIQRLRNRLGVFIQCLHPHVGKNL